MNEQTFLDAIDDGILDLWTTLAAWSDWLEDQNKSHRARAVRFLLKQKLAPVAGVYEGNFTFTWPTQPDLFLAISLMSNRGFSPEVWSRRSEAYKAVVHVLEGLAILVEGLQG